MTPLGAMVGAWLPERTAAKLAARGKKPNALVGHPPPPIAGDPATARRLVGGVLLFDGRLVESQDPTPWFLTPPDDAWAADLHGHGWLDDAFAAEDPKVWAHLSNWAWEWLENFEPGNGPGWRPDLVARRLTRQIAYSAELLIGQPAERSRLFFDALGIQTAFLEWRWQHAKQGVQRLEALSGLANALISLRGTGRATRQAVKRLGKMAAQIVQPDGAVASRSPEDLAQIVSLLEWSAVGIEDAGLKPNTDHLKALQRAAPALKTLRHPDGSLGRFHGGRAGNSALLDRLLVQVSARALAPVPSGPVMGYARLTGARTFCILDASNSPTSPYAATAHSSALAFEFSAAEMPMIVQCGSGMGFGERLARSSRRGPSHSTVELADHCPASVLRSRSGRHEENLAVHGHVMARTSRDDRGSWALCESSQYEEELGLVIERRLHLSANGEQLEGEDTALATSAAGRGRMARVFGKGKPPCPITVRFHLHPRVRAKLALSGRAVALTHADGSRWIMRTDADRLEVEPSLYFDETRPKPRATLQIVASSDLLEYWGRITWSLDRIPEGAQPG
ncbi:MAG: heparinase II/III family protein [Pseudomonadota bacterium]